MIEGPDVNPDLTELVVVHADDVPWRPTEHKGVYCKVLDRLTDPSLARETCLYKLNPGTSLPAQTLDERLELFVVYGRMSDGESEIAKYTYRRIPPATQVHIQTDSGCVVLYRRRRGRGEGGDKFTIDAGVEDNFEAWGERGSEKIPLEDPAEPNVGAWLGRMIPDLHIPEHDHANGEEIFVLEGTIEDEFCAAGPRTWVRFPVGFRHSPFSWHADVLMLVREGDVIPNG